METVGEIKQCSFCKEEIHKDAIKCKHCGSMLVAISLNPVNSEKEGSLWISIVSLGFGILGIVKKLNGEGMAIAGIVLSSLAILIAISN